MGTCRPCHARSNSHSSRTNGWIRFQSLGQSTALRIAGQGRTISSNLYQWCERTRPSSQLSLTQPGSARRLPDWILREANRTCQEKLVEERGMANGERTVSWGRPMLGTIASWKLEESRSPVVTMTCGWRVPSAIE